MKENARKFLSEEMCINLDHLGLKFRSSEVKSSAKNICEFINSVVCIFAKTSSSKALEGNILEQFSLREQLMFTEEANVVLDSLRHAFDSFSERSLKDLYFYQENHCWYPKIVLRSVVDIAELEGFPETITVYRGCDEGEYYNNVFGQSWSLSEKVAEEFAFQHYQSQPWFDAKRRVVVRAEIPKSEIYLSRIYHHEKELVVNPFKLFAKQTVA